MKARIQINELILMVQSELRGCMELERELVGVDADPHP